MEKMGEHSQKNRKDGEERKKTGCRLVRRQNERKDNKS